MKNKEIVFVMKLMNGGGAERVISILSQAMVQRGFHVTLILTHQHKADALLENVDSRVDVIALEDQISEKQKESIGQKYRMTLARLRGKLSRTFLHKESELALIEKYHAQNYKKVFWLKNYFKQHSKSTVIAFMYDSIFVTLLSVTQSNNVIISERGAPQQYVGSKTTMAFLRQIFPKANHMIFQSPDVQEWYLDNIKVNGTVIFNPIKSNLPDRFIGVRKSRIVNFCRISQEKNLLLLIEAFDLLQKEYPEYELFIYGDVVTDDMAWYVEKIRAKVSECDCKEKIHLLPARSDIHKEIRDYKMFVSSSDHEGMSNSMLEAMAIGLPVICTDCPAGGARAIIRNYENGILVPVKDVKYMYQAMKTVIENAELSEKMSENAFQIRNDLDVENIVEKWIEVMNIDIYD